MDRFLYVNKTWCVFNGPEFQRPPYLTWNLHRCRTSAFYQIHLIAPPSFFQQLFLEAYIARSKKMKPSPILVKVTWIWFQCWVVSLNLSKSMKISLQNIRYALVIIRWSFHSSLSQEKIESFLTYKYGWRAIAEQSGFSPHIWLQVLIVLLHIRSLTW